MTAQIQTVQKQATGVQAQASDRQTIYTVGAVAALLVVLTAFAEIMVTFLPGGYVTADTVTGWFELLQANPFLGLRNLGLLNIIMTALSIPMMLAIYWAHRRQSPSFAALAMICSLIGLAVFYATNRAFPMYELSLRYAAADAAQRSMLEAAGQAMLSVGQSHTPGTFLAFFFSEVGGILMGAVMLRVGLFNRAAALTGLIGYSFLLVYEVLVSFMPATHNAALVIAMTGGLANMAWYILVAVRLVKLGQSH